MQNQKNVLGTKLECCCKFPMTGFYRDGFCRSGEEDLGRHTVCIEVNNEFLEYSIEAGNDLTTPHPEMDFPGLIEGDRWCLCALRWQEAYEAGCAPKVILSSTNISALEVLNLDDLKSCAYDESEKNFPAE